MKIFIVWIAVASLICGSTATRLSAASLRNAKQGSITGDAGGDHKAYPEMPVPKAFPFPQNIAPARCPTGNYHVGCFYDTQTAHQRWYDEEVPKEDRLPMTPDLCYAFCSKVSGVQYFGVTRGDRCYCTPFFHNTGMNAHGDCDMPCVGDHSRMCGGMERSDVYVLHDCKNLPDLSCKKSPQPPLHAKMFNSTYYRTGTPCSNAKRQPLTTLETFCDIECDAGYYLAKNEIRCVRKGDPLGYSWAQTMGQAVCQSISCGKPPDYPHTTHSGAPALYGVAVPYSCQLGYSMDGNATGPKDFKLMCGKDGTFNTTKDLGCHIVSCGKCPEGGKKYNNSKVAEKKTRYYGDECSYTCDEGYTLDSQPDGKKSQKMNCLATGEFAEPKICEPVSCGVASPVPNAKLITKVAVQFPGSAEYVVNDGYTMTGKYEPPGYTFIRKCTKDGVFSDIIPPKEWKPPVTLSIQSASVEELDPEIEPVPCGKPPEVENAFGRSKNLTFGQTAKYYCSPGFTLTGKSDGETSAELLCGSKGTYLWKDKESPMPKCLPVECGAAPTNDNAKLITKLESDVVTTASPSLVYECNPGYSSNKNDNPFHPKDNKTSITCQGTGEFTSAEKCVDITDCTPTHCGDYGDCVEVDPPTAKPFSNYNCKCEAGYMQVTEKMAPPAVDKKVCVNINDCPTPIEDACGGRNKRGRKRGRCIDGLMTYTCKPTRGYRVKPGPDEPQGENETCVPKECKVPKVENSESSITGEANYDTPPWTYTCKEGYTITGAVGGGTKFDCKCLASGGVAKTKKCLPVSCGPPPSVSNTVKSPNYEDMKYPNKILYTADTGYSLDGKKDGDKTFEVECKADGKQVGEEEVKPVECGKVPKQENGTYDADKVLVFGDSTTVKCDKGHSIDKTPLPSSLSYEITCEAGGELDIPDVCQYITIPLVEHEIDCGKPPKVEHSTVEGSQLFGGKMTYTAVEGYSLDGSNAKSKKKFEIRCKPTEVYTATRTFQRISCGPSKEVPNSESADFIEFAGGSFVQSAHVFSSSVSKTMARRQDKSYNMLFGDAVKYTCMEGHRIGKPNRPFVGNRNPKTLTLTCDGQGNIVPTKPTNPRELSCLPVSCGIPTGKKCANCDADIVELEKGEKPFISFTETQQFICDDGFSVDGKPSGEQDFIETCEANGRLSKKNKCIDIDWCLLSKCGGPKEGTCVDQLMNYTCDCEPGFKAVTTGIHTKCVQIDECETRNGNSLCAGKGDYGTCTDKKLHYDCNCNQGYEVQKMRRRQYCTPIKCPSIEARNNSDPEKVGQKMYYKKKASYTCKSGYSMNGDKDGKKEYTVECLSDGTLSKVDDCKPVACECADGSCVPFVKNGAIKGSFDIDKALVYGESAQFECDEGFTTSGDAAGLTEFSVTCTAEATLTEPRQCLPVECGEPPKIFNSVISESKELVYKDVVTVTCNEGYTMTGKVGGSTKFDFECLATGKIDGSGSCKPISCGTSPDIAHAEFNSRELFYGESVRVSCHSGFSVDADPNGESSFVGTCAANGKLEGMLECKPVSCGTPAKEKGAVSKDPETFFNETATWTCTPGFSTDGHPGGDDEFTRPCNAHGKFTSSSPNACVDINFCEGSPCTSNGMCTDLGEGMVNPGYSCKCADGFQIKKKADGSETCSEDDCAGNPCGDGGTCTDLSKLAEKEGIYSCECDEGYEVVETEKDKPTCVRIKCGTMPTDIQNIVRKGKAPKVTIVTWDKNVSDMDKGVPILKAGDTVKYTCATGYSTDQMATKESYEFTVECLTSGSFDRMLTPDSECLKIKCDNYQRPMVKFAKLSQPNENFFEYGDVLDFQCDPGYTITGKTGGDTSFSITCTAKGVFTEVHADCLPVECSVPAGVNAVSAVGYSSVQYPKSVTYTCLSGYLAKGKKTYSGTCGTKGEMEFEGASTCEAVECGTPEPQMNSDLLVTSSSVFLTSLNKSHGSSGNLFKRTSPQQKHHMALVQEATHEDSETPLVSLPEGFVMTTVHAPVVVRCHAGYTVGGLSGAVVSYALECMNSGKIVAMSGNKVETNTCEQPGFQVSGVVTDAQSADLTLSGTVLKFIRDGNVITESTSKSSGRYTATLPADSYRVEASKDGYITYEGDLTVVTSISSGGAADVALSKVLPEGEWRVTLQWAKKSRDLDSWTFLGKDAQEKVYFVEKEITDSDTGIEAILDRDDVSGYGPETTTFKGIGTCVKKSNCLVKFYVDNYTPDSKDMGESKAKITLYRGSSTIKEYTIPTSAGDARQWPIFTLDASEGAVQQVYDGDQIWEGDELVPNPKPYGSEADYDYDYSYYDYFLQQIDGTAW